MAGSGGLFSAWAGSLDSELSCYAFAEQGGRLAMGRSRQGRCATMAVVGVTGGARLDAAIAAHLRVPEFGNSTSVAPGHRLWAMLYAAFIMRAVQEP